MGYNVFIIILLFRGKNMKKLNILILAGIVLLAGNNYIIHKNLNMVMGKISSIERNVDRIEDYMGDNLYSIEKSIHQIEESKKWTKDIEYSYSSFDKENKSFTINLSFFVTSIATDSENYVKWINLDENMKIVSIIPVNSDNLSITTSAILPLGSKYRAIFVSKNNDTIREEVLKDIDFNDEFEYRFFTDCDFVSFGDNGDATINISIFEENKVKEDLVDMTGKIESIETEIIYEDNVFFTIDIINDSLTTKKDDHYYYEKSINIINLGIVKNKEEAKEFYDLDKFDEILFKTTIKDSNGLTYELINNNYRHAEVKIY